jgi:hypothetical protein
MLYYRPLSKSFRSLNFPEIAPAFAFLSEVEAGLKKKNLKKKNKKSRSFGQPKLFCWPKMD